MIVAGIDVGSLTTKIVIMDNSKVLSYTIVASGEEGDIEAKKGIESLGFSISDIKTIVATGAGRKSISFANKYKTILPCLTKGALFLFPNAKTIVDVGAESSTIVTINENGGIEDFSTSDKCASGTGIFLQSMAKLLQISLEEMGNLSLSAKNKADISGVCAVFAEQEVCGRPGHGRPHCRPRHARRCRRKASRHRRRASAGPCRA